MKEFKFVIELGAIVKKVPPTPWEVGRKGDEITIQLQNDDDDVHRVRMVKFKYKDTGKSKDPLTGPKGWLANPHQSSGKSKHHVKDTEFGTYEFMTELDGVEMTDPEIIVDPPDPPITDGKPKRTVARKAAVRKAGAKRAKKAKAAKRATTANTAKKSAKRATKRKK